MVKLRTFAVLFDNNKTIYKPGDVVSGQLQIELDETMEMKEIRIKLSGKASVRWNEGKHSFYGKERFFTESSVVHGGESEINDRVSLAQGRHTFPFRFQLPQPLASSYEDNVGHIRYYVKTRIVKPWQFDNKNIAAISVLATLNLNNLNNMTAPTGGSATKNLCCWCCASGPIEGEVRVNRRGYVPGEWVVANATLSNYSSSRVKTMSIEIVRIVTYHATAKSRTDIVSLEKKLGPPCNPGDVNVSFNNVTLQFPPVPPSESAHCSVIDIQYAVMLMGQLRKCAINFRALAHITVGTVPLNSLPMYSELPEASAQDSPTTKEARPADYSTAAPASSTFGTSANVPPPSYAAATVGSFDVRGNDEHTTGDASFTPQYTFYDWNQSAFKYT